MDRPPQGLFEIAALALFRCVSGNEFHHACGSSALAWGTKSSELSSVRRTRPRRLRQSTNNGGCGEVHGLAMSYAIDALGYADRARVRAWGGVLLLARSGRRGAQAESPSEEQMLLGLENP